MSYSWKIRVIFMENSAPSNIWTYYAHWHCYSASLIETDVFEISCLLCMSLCFIILLVIISRKNKFIIYLVVNLFLFLLTIQNIFNNIIPSPTFLFQALRVVSKQNLSRSIYPSYFPVSGYIQLYLYQLSIYLTQ